MIGPLEPLFADGFAQHRDRFIVIGDLPADASFVRGPDLLDGHALTDALDRRAKQFPEAPRRAVASQWARSWAMSLLPVVLTASLVLDHELPIAIQDIAVRIDEDGNVATFALPHAGRRITPADPFERFDLLVNGHLAPLFAAAGANAQVSPRVLFGQVGFLFGWLTGVAGSHPLASANAERHGRELLEAPRWSDKRPNPMFRPIVTVDDDGHTIKRKRVCCLSNELSRDAGPCPMCPTPKRIVKCERADAVVGLVQAIGR